MTSSSIQSAIEKELGWVSPPPDCAAAIQHKWFNTQDGCCYDVTPNFMHSLDACSVFERTLITAEEQRSYRWYIINNTSTNFETLTATTAQRCEAFLRTRGLWRDE